jgi:hypothetical protein
MKPPRVEADLTRGVRAGAARQGDGQRDEHGVGRWPPHPLDRNAGKGYAAAARAARATRWKARKRKTDYGTIVLHWTLVAALSVAFLTGLKIATETPGHTWINWVDGILPHSSVWTAHMRAALVLATVPLAYVIYMLLSGLAGRIRVDRVRMMGLLGKPQARWGAINVLLYWAFFLILLSQIATGSLLYFGLAADAVIVTLHWFGAWAILGYAALHVFAHWALGGKPQLLRIFRPSALVSPTPPPDPIQLLAQFAERSPTAPPPAAGPAAVRLHDVPRDDRRPVRQTDARQADARQADAPRPPQPASVRPSPSPHPGPERASSRTGRRGPMLQANPFMVAVAVAIAGAFFLVTLDREEVDTLHVRRIARSDAPVLDGDTSDLVWRTAPPLYVATGQGGNFDSAGATTVEIRAVHDDEQVYFLFTWNDPTRSLKQLPLIKTARGWRLLHDGYEAGDEHAYSEDKFAVLLTASSSILAGDYTFHAGPRPIADEPRTLSGRGLHYTMGEGVYADVWEWKATSTGPSGWMDDEHFGPPLAATAAQRDGLLPYHGGFAPDPGIANYAVNFTQRSPEAYDRPLTPRRLPKDFRAMLAAMGPVDLDPDHGESEHARWFMTQEESAPYSPELDALIPVGTVIPGVIVSGAFSDDRADVRCAARWAAGRWALEVTRRLDTHSKYDVPISTGIYMRVAAFDHSQIRHTRHVRPIRLEVE